MKKFADIDFVAGVASGAFAVAAVYLQDLTEVLPVHAAGAFALLALSRWYLRFSSKAK